MTPAALDLLASVDAEIASIEADMEMCPTDIRMRLREERHRLLGHRRRLAENLPRVEAEAIAWSARMDAAMGDVR